MKNTIALLFFLLFCTSQFIAQEYTNSEFTYVIHEQEVMITQYNDNNKNVIIPSALNGYPVTAIGEKAFAKSDIISIEIPYSINYIDNNAFENCTNLTYADIENFDLLLGNDVFLNCPKLILNIQRYSNLNIYAELNKLDYNIIISPFDLGCILENPIDEAIKAGGFIATLGMMEELSLQEKVETPIPAQEETFQNSRPVYGWYKEFYIMFLESSDSKNITLDLVLGYDLNDDNALDEIIARKVEIQDFVRHYFLHKKSSELTPYLEKNIKLDLKKGINDLCSYPIIKDVRFLEFDIW